MTTSPEPGDRPDPGRLRPATLVVSAGRPPVEPNAPVVTPVVMTSTYVASDGAEQPGDLSYARWKNPTWTALEDTVGELEGGQALSFGSGMAAISAVLGLLPIGGTVVIPEGPYSGTQQISRLLRERGAIEVREVPVADTAAVLAALPGADLVLIESPTNPLLEVADLAAIAAGTRAAGVLLAVDNTFATPLLQRPLDLGADLVVHSATKYLSGHSDVLSGIVVTAREDLAARLHEHRTLHGAIPGPWEAWLVLRGIRTLALRVERAGSNAAELARRLAGHPAISLVRHPSLPEDPGHQRALAQMSGFGAIIRIELAAGPEAAERLCSATRLWVHATSLGGVESSLERRRRHATEPTVVPESLVRLSVGIEDVEDLWADLDGALRSP
jgi:cystathionine gamma-synthase